MSSKSQQSTTREKRRCRECGEICKSMDHLIDHLSDAHDAFDWVVQGRPLGGADK